MFTGDLQTQRGKCGVPLHFAGARIYYYPADSAQGDNNVHEWKPAAALEALCNAKLDC